jgi:hypothetical protein
MLLLEQGHCNIKSTWQQQQQQQQQEPPDVAQPLHLPRPCGVWKQTWLSHGMACWTAATVAQAVQQQKGQLHVTLGWLVLVRGKLGLLAPACMCLVDALLGSTCGLSLRRPVHFSCSALPVV